MNRSREARSSSGVRSGGVREIVLGRVVPLTASLLFLLSLYATQAVAAEPAVKAAVAGEKLDSGLGELPHYSKWTDPTGKNPMGPKAPEAQRVSLR